MRAPRALPGGRLDAHNIHLILPRALAVWWVRLVAPDLTYYSAVVIGVVVVTHGQLATELVNAAEMIVGDLPQFTAVSIGWHDEVNDAREDISQAIERVRGEEGVLLLTDMFGGTPSNLGMTFLETDRLEVITGVNLPMLIKLASLRRSSDLLAVAKEMRDHGRNAIWVASDLLRGEKSQA
jgi:PTS system mannose-specific IIA component